VANLVVALIAAEFGQLMYIKANTGAGTPALAS
jgi:hypothetical protein